MQIMNQLAALLMHG